MLILARERDEGTISPATMNESRSFSPNSLNLTTANLAFAARKHDDIKIKIKINNEKQNMKNGLFWVKE